MPGKSEELLRVHLEAEVAVLALYGRLDAAAGRQLVDALATMTDGTVTRVDLDLQHVDSFNAEGAAALVACRDLAERFSGGLHYRTGRGAGCDALLAAYAEES